MIELCIELDQDKVLQGWGREDASKMAVWQVCEGVRVGRVCCKGVLQGAWQACLGMLRKQTCQ